MRTLTFGVENKDKVLYADLVGCFTAGERLVVNGVKGYRTAVSIYEKLERVAVQTEVKNDKNEVTNVYTSLNVEFISLLSFEEAEYDLLKSCVEAVLGGDDSVRTRQQQQQQITRNFDSRRALAVLDFIQQASKA